MSVGKSQFLRSQEADSLRVQLQAMVDDPSYNTTIRYSSQSQDHPGFVEKHMEYMSNYLSMNHAQYISNLRLMTKVN